MSAVLLQIIRDSWIKVIRLLKSPVWAVITFVCIGITGWMTFEYVNNIGVVGIRYETIGNSSLFVFLFSILFRIIPFESFFGFFSEGPFLLPFVIAVIAFSVFRIAGNSFFEAIPDPRTIEKSLRLGILLTYFIKELMITAVFLAVFLAALFILSVITNTALGWAVFHSMVIALFLIPVFQLFILLLRRLIHMQPLLFAAGLLLFSMFIILESIVYFPDQRGLTGLFGSVQQVFQWISPVHYGVAAIVGESTPVFLLNLLLLLILGAGIGVAVYLIPGRKGADL